MKRFILKHFFLRRDLPAGNHASPHILSGGDFSEIREYLPGDRLSRIDWNATAKFQKLFSRTFSSSSKVEVLFVVNTGNSMRLKQTTHILGEIATMLGGFFLQHQDRIGVISYRKKMTEGYQSVQKLNNLLDACRPSFESNGSLPNILDDLLHVRDKVIFFITDEYVIEGYEKLGILARRNSCFFAHIGDGLDRPRVSTHAQLLSRMGIKNKSFTPHENTLSTLHQLLS